MKRYRLVTCCLTLFIIGCATENWYDATLHETWTTYSSDFSAARFMKDDDGVVRFDGVIQSGLRNTTIFRLPIRFRPDRTQLFACADDSKLSSLEVDSTGLVTLKNGNASKLSLSGITFATQGWASTPAYANNWATVAGYSDARFFRDSKGFVHIDGVVASGSLGTGVFSLGKGHKPVTYSELYISVSEDDVGVAAAGQIEAFPGSSGLGTPRNVVHGSPYNNKESLCGITFASSRISETWIYAVYKNSWVGAGGTWSPARYLQDSDGFVHLSGAIKSGDIERAAFTLPLGFRPRHTVIFAVASNNVMGQLTVNADSGEVVVDSGDSSLIGLSGVSFSTQLSPTPAPTPLPTPVPTPVPSASPTPLPSELPTSSPTPVILTLSTPSQFPAPTTLAQLKVKQGWQHSPPVQIGAATGFAVLFVCIVLLIICVCQKKRERAAGDTDEANASTANAAINGDQEEKVPEIDDVEDGSLTGVPEESDDVDMLTSTTWNDLKFDGTDSLRKADARGIEEEGESSQSSDTAETGENSTVDSLTGSLSLGDSSPEQSPNTPRVRLTPPQRRSSSGVRPSGTSMDSVLANEPTMIVGAAPSPFESGGRSAHGSDTDTPRTMRSSVDQTFGHGDFASPFTGGSDMVSTRSLRESASIEQISLEEGFSAEAGPSPIARVKAKPPRRPSNTPSRNPAMRRGTSMDSVLRNEANDTQGEDAGDSNQTSSTPRWPQPQPPGQRSTMRSESGSTVRFNGRYEVDGGV